MTMLRVLTNSERSWMSCRRLWWFGYREGLSRYLTPAPLRQGGLFHKGVEAWSRTIMMVQSGATKKPMQPGDVESEIIEPWLEKREEYRAGLDPDQFDLDADREKDEAIAIQTSGMLKGYFVRWEGDVDEWEYIAVEPQLSRWLVHPGHGGPIVDYVTVKGKRRRRRWAYGGAIDLVWRHRPTDTYWIRENKTAKIAAGSAAMDAYVRGLHFAPQTRGYAFALRDPIPEHAVPGLERPIHVEGVVKDVARKAVPSIPKPLVKCAVCKHSRNVHDDSGCSGSAACACNIHRWRTAGFSTAAIDTTAAVYREAVLAAGLDPDDYADVIGALPGIDSYFKREHYDFSDAEIEDFGVDAAWSALELINEERAEYHTRQTGVCQGVGSFGCPGGYESICMEDGPMARASYRVKTIRHEELVGDLAEPWVGTQREADKPKGGIKPQAGKTYHPDGPLIFTEEPDPFEEAEMEGY